MLDYHRKFVAKLDPWSGYNPKVIFLLGGGCGSESAAAGHSRIIRAVGEMVLFGTICVKNWSRPFPPGIKI